MALAALLGGGFAPPPLGVGGGAPLAPRPPRSSCRCPCARRPLGRRARGASVASASPLSAPLRSAPGFAPRGARAPARRWRPVSRPPRSRSPRSPSSLPLLGRRGGLGPSFGGGVPPSLRAARGRGASGASGGGSSVARRPSRGPSSAPPPAPPVRAPLRSALRRLRRPSLLRARGRRALAPPVGGGRARFGAVGPRARGCAPCGARCRPPGAAGAAPSGRRKIARPVASKGG